MDSLIRLEQVGFRYRGAKVPILRGVDLTVRKGDRILLRGRSGSGKSTLLAILAGLAPEYVAGELSGERELFSRRRGVVLQNPEAQVVTPTVEEEVAFALENQGKDPSWIRRRVRETLEALGIAHLADRHPLTLSGGECQRVSLAAALAMEPEVLFLDEPTSYLDEESSKRFFLALELLHPETALVVVEHRLDDVSRVCHKAYQVQEDGSLTESDFTPERLESCVLDTKVRDRAGRSGERGGQVELLEDGGKNGIMKIDGAPVLWVEGLSHWWPMDGKRTKYGTKPESGGARNGSDNPHGTPLFHDLHLTVGAGEIVALLGPSGAGKTTLLGKISGRFPVEKGKVFINGKDIATLSKEAFYSLFMVVPQNPEHMFLADTVREELIAGSAGYSTEKVGAIKHSNQFIPTYPKDVHKAASHPHETNREGTIERVAEQFGLAHRLQAHPFRLSEGEKRRLNLAVAFAVRRPLYLLDEPTYGLDDQAKILLREDLRTLAEEGVGVLFVTHDKAFAETTAHRVYTLKEGQLVREERHVPLYCPA